MRAPRLKNAGNSQIKNMSTTSTETKCKLNNELEAMIDAHGLGAVISAISDVCDAKAQHISENWQDESLANVWQEAANMLASDVQVSYRHVS